MKYLMCIVFFLVTSLCYAEDEVKNPYDKEDEVINPYDTLHTLPTPKVKEVDGVEKVWLTPDEWRMVMLIAMDYQGLFYWRLATKGILDAHNATVDAYELKIASYEESIKVLKADRSYLNIRVKELESTILKGDPSHKIEKVLMWGVILVETVTIGALGVSGYIQTN
jgi:hypothetical protein